MGNTKLANPAPLGLMGFGMTTILLNLHNIGLFPMDGIILAMGIFYGGIAQIFAGLPELLRLNINNAHFSAIRNLQKELRQGRFQK
jgi:succinate-acetate transporter protein